MRKSQLALPSRWLAAGCQPSRLVELPSAAYIAGIAITITVRLSESLHGSVFSLE